MFSCSISDYYSFRIVRGRWDAAACVQFIGRCSCGGGSQKLLKCRDLGQFCLKSSVEPLNLGGIKAHQKNL